jgi:hypothetical protein
MALNAAVKKALDDLETALENVISSDAIAAVEGEINSVLPAGAQAVALELEAASLNMAQTALQSLLAKIPQA